MFRHGSVYWLMWFWQFIASFIPGVGQAERMAAAGIVKGRAVAGRVVAMERCPSSNGLEVVANLVGKTLVAHPVFFALDIARGKILAPAVGDFLCSTLIYD